MFNKKIQDEILEATKNAELNLTITEDSIVTKTQRITIRKHLERLEKNGKLSEFKKGKCRIFVLKKVGEETEINKKELLFTFIKNFPKISDSFKIKLTKEDQEIIRRYNYYYKNKQFKRINSNELENFIKELYKYTIITKCDNLLEEIETYQDKELYHFIANQIETLRSDIKYENGSLTDYENSLDNLKNYEVNLKIERKKNKRYYLNLIIAIFSIFINLLGLIR